MTAIRKNIYGLIVAVAGGASLASCSMEAPFADGGEGNLTITTDIKGDVTKHTRAIGEDELSLLREKCVVYIENSKGVIRKYKGLDNIPEQIRLRTGEYVAEAWSGDSVSASFDKKFYRGWEKFEMTEGQNSLTLRCNIANVLVSVDPASLDVSLSDLKVTFSHSRGSLEFDANNIPEAKGYFMMPNADKDLDYKVEGKKSDGSAFVKEGKIEGVQRAHEYCMTITEDERPVTEGGALIRLTIADIPVIEEDVEIFSAPVVRGDGFDIDSQIVSVERDFKDTRVYMRGYFGLSSVEMEFSSNFTGLTNYANILAGDANTELASKGIMVERRESKDASIEGNDVKVDELYVTFTKAFLDALPASEQEYTVTFNAVDGNHKENSGTLRIANDNAAVENIAPVTTVAVSEMDLTAVGARSASLIALLNTPDATGYGIKYRKQGTYEWTEAYPSSASGAAARRVARANAGTRAAAAPYSVKLTGLEPAATYEYIAFADGYDSNDVQLFTTESEFTIVNSSFEDWSTYSASTLAGEKTVILPGTTGDKLTSFWGSGNEGAATANKVLTDKSTDMVHSGTYSARLGSSSALGIIAAGNIFIGHYVKTDGTNGVLSLGRPYNGSHPSKVRVFANYRPGSNVTIKKGNDGFCPDGFKDGNDHGQVYVALTVGTVDIRTNSSNRKLFNPDDEQVLAYGQVTWTEAFGPDGALQEINIPFTYKESAKTTRPTHLVIVASASKYGDYFAGSAGSVMYLDDFELVYE